jgi:hypothetical protein
MKKPSEKQVAALNNLGIIKIPPTHTAAQAIIRRHSLSKSKRGKNGRLANRERRRQAYEPVNPLDACTIRFECPICGGDHKREDHQR